MICDNNNIHFPRLKSNFIGHNNTNVHIIFVPRKLSKDTRLLFTMGHGRLRMRQMDVNFFDAEHFNSEHNNGVN